MKDGLVPRATIEELKEYRARIAERINTFLGGVYREATAEERATMKRLNDNTVNKAMALICKQLIDMDYVAVYLLEYLYKFEHIALIKNIITKTS